MPRECAATNTDVRVTPSKHTNCNPQKQTVGRESKSNHPMKPVMSQKKAKTTLENSLPSPTPIPSTPQINPPYPFPTYTISHPYYRPGFPSNQLHGWRARARLAHSSLD